MRRVPQSNDQQFLGVHAITAFEIYNAEHKKEKVSEDTARYIREVTDKEYREHQMKWFEDHQQAVYERKEFWDFKSSDYKFTFDEFSRNSEKLRSSVKYSLDGRGYMYKKYDWGLRVCWNFDKRDEFLNGTYLKP